MSVSYEPAIVVGAGPYGLAVAAHLRGRGVPVRVFGEPMSAWTRNMPVGMFLKSAPSASSLSAPKSGYTLLDYCRETSTSLGPHGPVPIELFARYGQWFQDQLVPVEQVRVVSVRQRADRGFDVALDTGEVVTTHALVMAAGHVQFAYVPDVLQRLAGEAPLPTERLSHACHHADLSELGGSTVAVVGAGQSALESAALLHEAGALVDVIARRPALRWAGVPGETRSRRDRIVKPMSPLGPGWSLTAVHRGAAMFRHLPARTRVGLVGSVLGPSGSWWLRPRFDGVVNTHLGTEIRDAWTEGDKVVLEYTTGAGAPTRLVVDHVLAATGYRIAPGAIATLEPGVRDQIDCLGGYPVLNGSFESSVPGLYFAGLSSAATFGPLMRFVCGTEFAAPRTAAGVARRLAGAPGRAAPAATTG
jgi:hypothetical protein